MRLNINDLANYIANDLRLHIWTCVGVLVLGAILIFLLIKLSKARRELADLNESLDVEVRINRKQTASLVSYRNIFGPFPSLYEYSPERETGHNANEMTIAIDLDGVILEYVEPWTGIRHFGDPIPGAAESIQKLKDLGYTIAIYTTRNNAMANHNAGYDALELTSMVKSELDKGGIPYDFISLFKPLARYYIDDRAIRFIDWNQALWEMMKHEQVALNQRSSQLDYALVPVRKSEAE
jgi:hypothetical protein